LKFSWTSHLKAKSLERDNTLTRSFILGGEWFFDLQFFLFFFEVDSNGFSLVWYSRLPNWLRYMLPSSVLQIEEKSWNCYPICRSGKNILMKLIFNF
jgi:hypothetical protein